MKKPHLPFAALLLLLVLLAPACPWVPSDEAQKLAVAINAGNPAEVEALLDAGADPDARLAEGWRPLNLAASLGEAEIVRALLDAGADPDVRQGSWSGREDATPLMFGLGYPEIVDTLLAAGARVNARDYLGRTALMLAAGRGDPELTARLLDAGADVRAADERGGTALHYASGYPPAGDRGESVPEVRLLLAEGADPGALNECRRTPVYWAARRGWVATMDVLIDRGVEVDTACGDGTTALFAAALEGRRDAVERLLAAGAAPNPERSDGLTAREAALRQGHPAVAELLAEHGAR
jgi:ankyrin repeat protein